LFLYAGLRLMLLFKVVLTLVVIAGTLLVLAFLWLLEE
jgi:hypothetical protein